jgi:hypothetical protein
MVEKTTPATRRVALEKQRDDRQASDTVKPVREPTVAMEAAWEAFKKTPKYRMLCKQSRHSHHVDEALESSFYEGYDYHPARG